MAESHRGGVFLGSDQNDARSEARRVLLNVRVGRCRIDPVHDDIQRHGTGPFLDMSPQGFERVQGLRRVVYDSEDYQEGIRAFKGKRKPQFKGN